MYSVALVQNQSEMSHYACADARTLLSGYDFRLFTGDNIDELAPALSRRQVHAVVLGSNALNDKNILGALSNSTFATTLHSFLQSGQGFLGMQQIGLAMRKGPTMTLLPPPYNELLPMVTPPGDNVLRSGGLDVGSRGTSHLTLNYPHQIDLNVVRRAALDFRGYQGLYWHYWDQVDLADWDQVVVDPTSAEIRSLILASKESSLGRIVVCALPLDWQKQESLFRNLLVYAVEGRHNLATVRHTGDESFAYLRETLRARCHPFGEYTLPKDLAEVTRAVALDIHSTLLVGARLNLAELPGPLRSQVKESVQKGRMRIVDVGAGAFGIRSMSVIGHELRPLRLMVGAEVQIEIELRSGYIDDSFWSHVETLQTIEQMPNRLVNYGALQAAAFEITRNHDRDGSYDELFGPTCAYYWLRATYLGVDSEAAKQTAAWLRRRMPGQEPHDRALAYHALASVDQLTDKERIDLSAAVQGLDLSTLTESQLIVYLRSVLGARLPVSLIAPLAHALMTRKTHDLWIDLTTTATAAKSLLDVHELLLNAPEHSALQDEIESSVQSAVVLILRQLAQAEEFAQPQPYPWENKARTTMKCLQTWLKFDDMQELPVFELIENLTRADHDATSAAASRTALTVLQQISEENRRLRADAAKTDVKLRRLLADRRRFIAGAAAAALVGYILVTLLVGLAIESGSFFQGLETGFVGGWPFHTTVVGVILGVVSLLPVLRKRAHNDKEQSAATGP